MQVVLSATYSVSGDYGISIFLLSFLLNLVLLPLFHIAERWQEAERQVQSILKPKLQEFRKAFSGEERHSMVQTLYRQMGYHPIYAMRSSVGLLLQLPFWIAAYQFLSHYQPLQGHSFLLIEDLGKPDSILWGINVLPFAMTAANLAAAFVYTKKFSLVDQLQPLLISLCFLILLYNSPAGLLLYWTLNSVFSLLRIMAYDQLNLLQKIELRSKELKASVFQKRKGPQSQVIAAPYHAQVMSQALFQKIFESPYTLALLVGAYPALFYISNNWFMFKASQGVLIFCIFTFVVLISLSLYYVGLSWLIKKYITNNPVIIIQRLFVLVATVVLAYLLRHTFLEMLENQYLVFAGLVMLAAIMLAWFIHKIQIVRVNIVLVIMCVFLLGNGLVSSMTAKATTLVDKGEDELRQALYDQIKFIKKPNVYYIVPDGYPNQEALDKIFHIANIDFDRQLDSWNFTKYPSVFSNYRSTLSSMSAMFGMQHHFYRGSVGNFELLYSREFIVSNQNPVMRIFKNNGYQVHYVHDDEWLFTSGCFVDLCSPSVFLGEFMDILLPGRVQSSSVFATMKERFHPGLMERFLSHIDLIAEQEIPHVVYAHMAFPNHSHTLKQTVEELATFRKNYGKKVKTANEELTKIIQRILSKDPQALIIINGDHGAWGYGAYKYFDKTTFKNVPEELIALDHLGVLLAIRWPNDIPKYDQKIRTNINLFRYIFSYLSESEAILETKVPDDGYLTKGGGEGSILVEAVHDGTILSPMIEKGFIH